LEQLLSCAPNDQAVRQPYACVKVNGTVRAALLDSGSDPTAVNQRTANLASELTDWSRCEQLVEGVGGKISITDRVRLTLEIGRRKVSVLCIVIPDLPVDMIIGTKFMAEYGITLDLRLCSFGLDGELHPFVGKNSFTPEVSSFALTTDDHIKLSMETDCPEMDKQLHALIDEFRDLFGSEAKIAKGFDAVRINTSDAKPIAQRQRPMNFAKAKLVQEWALDQQERGLSEPAMSAWRHNLVLVPKKNGKTRLCGDYRAVNSVTPKFEYPMPNIREILDTIGRAKVFSTFDLAKGFNHLLIHPDDRPKLAYYAGSVGLQQPIVMPFGIKTAPAEFQKAINICLLPLINICVVVYIDDIAVYSMTPGDHLGDLRKFFEIMRERDFVLNPEKMQLFRKEISLLGHVVGNGIVKPDQAKVAAMQDFPEPTDVKGIRRFLGTVGYYRSFIPKFSLIAKPLSEQTSERSPFRWTQVERNAFNTLKTAVLGQVLNTPDMNGEFQIQCDASGVGLGAVLMNRPRGDAKAKFKPVSFISRALQGAEKNYSTTELECLAMVWSIEKFRQYIELSHFLVETDHMALKWLMATANPTGRIARWIMKLQSYDYRINHRPGKTNQVADALSRAPIGVVTEELQLVRPAKIFAILTVNRQDWTEVLALEATNENSSHAALTEFPSLKAFERSSLIKAQKEDERLNNVRLFLNGKELVGKLSPTEMATITSIADRAIVVDDLLVKYNNPHNVDITDDEFHFERICLPNGLTTDCIKHFHDSSLGGHLGLQKTYDRIQTRFYWHGMYKQIGHFVASCDVCQKTRDSNRLPYGKMAETRVRLPFEKLAVDLIGPLPRTKHGNEHALVVVDTCSGWTEIFPLRGSQATNKGCVEKMLSVFCRFGFPRLIVSDNGTQFATELWVSVMRKLNATAIFTTPYHPQSNPTERRNKDIKTFMRKYAILNHRDWDDKIFELMYVLNTTPLKSTKVSPAKLIFGREMIDPMDIMTSVKYSGDEQEVEPQRYVDRLAVRIRNIVKFASENKELAHRIDKVYYDKHRIEYEFEIGDLVLVDIHPLSDKAAGVSAKLSKRRDGPYRVETRENRLNYRLVNLTDPTDVVFAHIAQLTKYVSRDSIPATIKDLTVNDAVVPTLPKPIQFGLGKKRGRKPIDRTAVKPVFPPIEPAEPTTDELDGTARVTRARAKELADLSTKSK
jgi:hypothetical protein